MALKSIRRVQRLNLIVLVFVVGRLAFDLEELSAENWLPGVETLGDLLQVCGYRDYGLTPAQLGIRIFLNKRH